MAEMQRNANDATRPSQRNGGNGNGGNGGATATAVNRRLDALLDVLPVGVFTIGPDRRIRAINGEAARLAGVDAHAAVGQACDELLKCVYCAPECAARETQRTGEVRRSFPVELHRPDGTPFSVEIDSAPLGDGETAVTIRDVTETERLRRTLKERWVFHGLVGVSASMKEVVSQIRDVAPYDSTVLVLGESGTGKELVARAIHAESPRGEKAFVTVNCSAYSESLLESELFGHVRGAFTGADRERPGRFETAEGGTVFLDEIGDVSPKIQIKLLRVLQEREVERVGENRARKVDVRIVAATNKDLHREVREGRFREDLFYRLNVLTLRLPPLRERKEDLSVLVDFLMKRACLRTGKDVVTIADEAMEALRAHAWPGNVRELENVLESAVVRCHEGEIRKADLPTGFGGEPGTAGPGQLDRVRAALHRAAGSVTLAARLLGVHRTTLWRWMCESGLKRKDFQPE